MLNLEKRAILGIGAVLRIRSYFYSIQIRSRKNRIRIRSRKNRIRIQIRLNQNYRIRPDLDPVLGLRVRKCMYINLVDLKPQLLSI